MPFKRVKTQRVRNSLRWDGEKKRDGEDDEMVRRKEKRKHPG